MANLYKILRGVTSINHKWSEISGLLSWIDM